MSSVSCGYELRLLLLQMKFSRDHAELCFPQPPSIHSEGYKGSRVNSSSSVFVHQSSLFHLFLSKVVDTSLHERFPIPPLFITLSFYFCFEVLLVRPFQQIVALLSRRSTLFLARFSTSKSLMFLEFRQNIRRRLNRVQLDRPGRKLLKPAERHPCSSQGQTTHGLFF